MAPIGKIYSYPNNFRVNKTLAVARLNGVEVEVVPDFVMGTTNKTPDFLAKFPLGKVPAFESADGLYIAESDAIVQYVADIGPFASQLLGSNARERAKIRQWISFDNGELQINGMTLLGWRIGLTAYDEKVETRALGGLERALSTLETSLEGNTWIIGTEKPSLADISLAATLSLIYKLFLDDELRPKYPNVLGYFKRVISSEGMKEVFGESVFIQKRKVFEG